MHYKKTVFAISLVLAAVVLGAASAPPDDHDHDHMAKNLKILPKNISHEDLHKVMDGFKTALGVKCGFCHAKSAADSTKLDFASDAKEEKITARMMMKMTARINKKYFDHMTDEGKPIKVACITCHNGHEHPEM